MRLAALSSDTMTQEQVGLYREILSGPARAGPARGPARRRRRRPGRPVQRHAVRLRGQAVDLVGYYSTLALQLRIFRVRPLAPLSRQPVKPRLRMVADSPGRWAPPLASDERIADGVAGHAEHGGKARHRHKEYKDWSADRVSGLRVDVDGRGPAIAVKGDHVPAGAVGGGAEVAGRARHHRPGDTALPHAETVRVGVNGRAPGAAVEGERVPFAIDGNAEAGRCARHCL
jgi:hypothetical protein